MKLTNRFFNHFKAMESGIYITTLTLIVIYFLGRDSGYNATLFKFFGVFILVNIAPALYLHIEYYLCNKGDVYEINHSEIIHYVKGDKIHYHKSELDRIIVYMSPSVYQGSNLHFLAIENYSYAKIYTKSGDILTITCLLTPKIEEPFKLLTGLAYERRKKLFCTLG